MDVLLDVQELTKIFPSANGPGRAAVDHVSFQMGKGEALGLVGQSGCGKSTLARLIARLLEPTAGSVRLAGEEITALRGKALKNAYRRMQMVFQSPNSSFDPRRTVGYSIGESLLNQGIPRKAREQETVRLLERCGLPGAYAQRYPHQLSGGECQRAAIARALAIRPSLLLCDEATSALDMTVQRQIVELLESLRQEQNLSLLFICHDLVLVQSFCSRVLVMHRGKIVEEGPTDQVISTPRSAYTRCLVEDSFAW